jgi:hypothetical protein
MIELMKEDAQKLDLASATRELAFKILNSCFEKRSRHPAVLSVQ